MKKNYIKKELSLEDLIKRKTEPPSEQVLNASKIFETQAKETAAETKKIEFKTPGKEKQSFQQTEKERVAVHGKTALPTQQTSDDVQINIKSIENILQKGLEETYKAMDPVSREQFKTQGEDTAKAINILLSKTKVKAKEIVDLIIKWLKLIPGINKFFAEQEAKIKADELMAQKRKKDEEKI